MKIRSRILLEIGVASPDDSVGSISGSVSGQLTTKDETSAAIVSIGPVNGVKKDMSGMVNRQEKVE